jgi:hypothetical protein
MIAFSAPTNQQGRLVLAPIDVNGNPVVLDPGAVAVTVLSGDGTVEINAATNGTVFRPGSVGVTSYHVEVDGEPGPGQSFLPFDVEMTVTPLGAVSAGESVTLEALGTPA